VVTVPVDEAAGTWRAGLLLRAAVALLACFLAALARHEVRADLSVHGRVHFSMLLRSAWPGPGDLLRLQSAMAYTQFGWLDPDLRGRRPVAPAGVADAGPASVIGIPAALILPWLFARIHDHRVFVVVFSASGTIGFVGLWLVPGTVPALWAALMGIGAARSRTSSR
jgi:CP family cyanate transporter-like MFS transporter